MFRHFSKQEARTLVFLAVPVFLGQIAQIAMSFVDTVVAGRAGTVDMAAVAVAHVVLDSRNHVRAGTSHGHHAPRGAGARRGQQDQEQAFSASGPVACRRHFRAAHGRVPCHQRHHRPMGNHGRAACTENVGIPLRRALGACPRSCSSWCSAAFWKATAERVPPWWPDSWGLRSTCRSTSSSCSASSDSPPWVPQAAAWPRPFCSGSWPHP